MAEVWQSRLTATCLIGFDQAPVNDRASVQRTHQKIGESFASLKSLERFYGISILAAALQPFSFTCLVAKRFLGYLFQGLSCISAGDVLGLNSHLGYISSGIGSDWKILRVCRASQRAEIFAFLRSAVG